MEEASEEQAADAGVALSGRESVLVFDRGEIGAFDESPARVGAERGSRQLDECAAAFDDEFAGGGSLAQNLGCERDRGWLGGEGRGAGDQRRKKRNDETHGADGGESRCRGRSACPVTGGAENSRVAAVGRSLI
jgi:hypothetical protein